MMQPSILITYASKHGATAQIAEQIGAVLHEHDLTAEVLPVEHVTNLAPYRVIVLGSAVYAGSWRKEAVAFLERYEQQLATRPVWLFSSGPTGEGDPAELMQGWRFPEAQQPIADRIQPRDIAFFHGALDTEHLSFVEKIVVKGLKVPTGDYRDWQMITNWAERIAEAIQDTPQQ
jgi:menaquinone-dependent protoporphyrinogen oxidase